MPWLHAVVDVPAEQLATAAGFWAEVLGWPVGEPWPDHPELRSFEPPDGTAYVHLQEVDGAPRVHLDVEAEEPRRLAGRAVDLGATLVAERDRWTTLTSPGGLPFCAVPTSGRRLPGPVEWQGHRSRMVQVCIDSPPSRHEAEVRFWRALLGERWFPSDAPEFAGKWHDGAGSPLQLLFQRLDEGEGPVRAHLDHGTDDVDAEVHRLLDAGAVDVGPGHGGWHVLEDPVGLVLCVTANSPEAVMRRDLG